MKKLFLLLFTTILVLSVTSCTENSRTRNFGGTQTINLPKGEKLLMVTWKENDLFYLTEPMEEAYTPKPKTFQESSSWGMIESKVIFVESR